MLLWYAPADKRKKRERFGTYSDDTFSWGARLMVEAWVALGRPELETMLAEIAASDGEAAALAQAVWEQSRAQEQPYWREQIAAAVLSYRSRWQATQISEITLEHLVGRGERIDSECLICL